MSLCLLVSLVFHDRAAVAKYSVEKGQAFRTKLIYFENEREFPGEIRVSSLEELRRAAQLQGCVVLRAASTTRHVLEEAVLAQRAATIWARLCT